MVVNPPKMRQKTMIIVMRNTLIGTYIIFLTSCGFVSIENDILLTGHKKGGVSSIPSSLKIVSWNIEKQNNPNWNLAFNTLLNVENPNIILLQEAKLNDDLKDNVRNKYWGFSPNLYTTGFYSGVFIASDIKPVIMSPRISKGTEPSIPFIVPPLPKPMIFSIYKIKPNKKLLVVNIHALNFTAIKFWKRENEFDEQMMLISNLVKNHKGPVIVAGDFNTWSFSRMDTLNSIFTSAGLIKNNFGSHKNNIKTCHFVLNMVMWSCGSKPLDHIFYKGLTPKSSRVKKTIVSDHNPLIVEFTIN